MNKELLEEVRKATSNYLRKKRLNEELLEAVRKAKNLVDCMLDDTDRTVSDYLNDIKQIQNQLNFVENYISERGKIN